MIDITNTLFFLVVCSILRAIVSRRWSTISPSYALTTRSPTAYHRRFKIVLPHTHTHHSSLEDITKKGGTRQSNSKASTIEHTSSTSSKLSTWSGRVWSEQHSRIICPAWGLLLFTLHWSCQFLSSCWTFWKNDYFVEEDHSTTLPTHPSPCCFLCKCCMYHL